MSQKPKGKSLRVSDHNLKQMTKKKGKPKGKDTLRGALRPSWERDQ